jgi:spermidine/putrescine transport system substrate-binding protein
MEGPNRMTRREFLAASAAMVGAGLMVGPHVRPAAAQTPTEAPEMAKLQGATINYLGWEGYDYAGALKPLTDKYDITVNATYGGSNDEIFGKLKAGSKGQYDVISIYHGTIDALYLNKMIQPIDTGRVAHWNDLFPPFRNQPWQVRDGKVWSVPFTFGNTPCTYNPEFVPNGIESWNDLLKPEFKGKVVTVDVCNQEIMVALLACGIDISQPATKEQLQVAKEWYLKLKPQLRAIVPSYGEMADVFARKEAWITSGSWTAIIGWAKEKGVELKYVIPKEGAAGWCDNYLIPDGANVDVAYAFINQMTSPEGAKELGTYLGQMMTNSKVVPLLSQEMQDAYKNAEVELSKTPFPPDAPLEPTDPNIASYAEWLQTWEEIKLS